MINVNPYFRSQLLAQILRRPRQIQEQQTLPPPPSKQLETAEALTAQAKRR